MSRQDSTYPRMCCRASTKQMVVVAELLLEGSGHLDGHRFVERLLEWMHIWPGGS
jgi:hypothetical protein